MFGLGIYAYLAAGLAIVALVGGFYLRARASGRNAERARQNRASLESLERQNEAAAAAPRDRDGLSKRLRDGEF